MLSEPEQRALQQIERSMATSDPDLAALLSVPPAPRRGRRARRLAYDAVFALSVLLGLPCLFLGQIGAGLGALLFAAVVLQARRMRFGRVTPPRDRRRRPGSLH
jgi:hypothetical protein